MSDDNEVMEDIFDEEFLRTTMVEAGMTAEFEAMSAQKVEAVLDNLSKRLSLNEIADEIIESQKESEEDGANLLKRLSDNGIIDEVANMALQEVEALTGDIA